MSVADLWSSYLPTTRWFQGKGLALRHLDLEPLGWYADGPDLWVRSELAQLDLEGGDGVTTHETYHLLVGYARPGTAEPGAVIGRTDAVGLGPVDVLDAPRSPRALHAFLRAICRPDTPGVAWLADTPDPDAPVRLFTGEQSHTSVAIGDSVLLKLYRRLASGPSLEPEVLGDLARQGAGAIVPALIGTWRTPDATTDLGFFQQLVPQARDGYEDAVRACAAGESLAEPMRALGATLADLHARLRDAYGTGTTRASRITGAMAHRLDQACAELAQLDALRPGLEAQLRVPDTDVVLQRIHGDFHLGQVLLGPHGWVIIDFEGEPLKTPRERREPDSAWRDVAGLLRSLDYARHTHPDPDGAPARAWLHDARTGFLTGYLGHDATVAPLLPAYEIDKAVYELRYETRNRPDWVATPWQALCEAASATRDDQTVRAGASVGE